MATAYYIPNGVKNLQPLFPAINFDNIQQYYVQVKDTAGEIVASGNVNIIGGCCDADDKVRVHFMNAAGAIDAINFKLEKMEHESSSDKRQSPTTYPLDKTQHSGHRFNVKSNDTYNLVTCDYTESNKDWLDELFDSPLAWMEWEGVQGQDDSYVPIIIKDKQFDKVKEQDRYIYEVRLEFVFSHQRFIIRN